MTRHQLIEKLLELAEENGSQASLAEKLGIGRAYLSDVIRGRRDPGPGLLAALGLRRVVEYVPIEKNGTGKKHRK